MGQFVFSRESYSKCEGIVNVWHIANQGPNKPVQLLSPDDKRIFLAFAVQTSAAFGGDYLILGGKAPTGYKLPLGNDLGFGGDAQSFRFQFRDFPDTVRGAIWAVNATASGHFVNIVAVSCRCEISAYEPPTLRPFCPVRYDSRSVTVSVNNTGRVKAFGNNSYRLSLLISCTSTLVAPVSIAVGPSPVIAWYGNAPPLNDKFAFRDYGPLLQQEVWIECNNAAFVDVNVTEVFGIPEMR